MQAAAAEAVKDLAVHEKQEVGLEERRKHASSKAKKLKKSLQDVRLLSLIVSVSFFSFAYDNV